MENNDLSSGGYPQLIFLWEGCMVLPPTIRRWSRPASVVRKAVLRENVLKRVWDLAWRTDFNMELATMLGDDYYEPLVEWVERHSLPFPHVHAFEGYHHANPYFTHSPSVARVFVGPDQSPFAFGPRTQQVPAEADWEPLR